LLLFLAQMIQFVGQIVQLDKHSAHPIYILSLYRSVDVRHVNGQILPGTISILVGCIR
jgi:hypothetical protein